MPSRLVVSPSLLVEVSRSLQALSGALDLTGRHLAGPRPAPPVGDGACALAYQSATHQLAGVVTSAVGRQRALAQSLAAAAALYAVLDGGRVQS